MRFRVFTRSFRAGQRQNEVQIPAGPLAWRVKAPVETFRYISASFAVVPELRLDERRRENIRKGPRCADVKYNGTRATTVNRNEMAPHGD